MGTQNTRLEETLARIRKTPGNEAPQRQAQMEASVECAIELYGAMSGLKVAVEDMANRTVLVANRLTAAIEKATDQAEVSSHESTNVALQSANLSRKLNRLTVWIIIAALLSAAAAVVQAWAAVHK